MEDSVPVRAKILQFLASKVINKEPINFDDFIEYTKQEVVGPSRWNGAVQRKVVEIGRRLYDVLVKGAVRRKVENLKGMRQLYGDLYEPIVAAKRAAPVKEAMSESSCIDKYKDKVNSRGNALYNEATGEWLGCSKIGRECCGHIMINGVRACAWKGQGKGCQRVDGAEFKEKQGVGYDAGTGQFKPKQVFAFDTDQFLEKAPFGLTGSCYKKNYKGGCSHLNRTCCNTQGQCKYQQGRGCRTQYPAEESKLKNMLPAKVNEVVNAFRSKGFSNPSFRTVFAMLERVVKSDLDYKPMFEYVKGLIVANGVPFDEFEEVQADNVDASRGDVVANIQNAVQQYLVNARAAGRPLPDADEAAESFKTLATRILSDVRRAMFPAMGKDGRRAFMLRFLGDVRSVLLQQLPLANTGQGVGEPVDQVREVVAAAVNLLTANMADGKYKKDKRKAVKETLAQIVADQRGRVSKPLQALIKNALKKALERMKGVDVVLRDLSWDLDDLKNAAQEEGMEDYERVFGDMDELERETFRPEGMADSDIRKYFLSHLDEELDDDDLFMRIKRRLADTLQAKTTGFQVSAEWEKETGKYGARRKKDYERYQRRGVEKKQEDQELAVAMQEYEMKDIRKALEAAGEVQRQGQEWVNAMRQYLRDVKRDEEAAGKDADEIRKILLNELRGSYMSTGQAGAKKADAYAWNKLFIPHFRKIVTERLKAERNLPVAAVQAVEQAAVENPALAEVLARSLSRSASRSSKAPSRSVSASPRKVDAAVEQANKSAAVASSASAKARESLERANMAAEEAAAAMNAAAARQAALAAEAARVQAAEAEAAAAQALAAAEAARLAAAANMQAEAMARTQEAQVAAESAKVASAQADKAASVAEAVAEKAASPEKDSDAVAVVALAGALGYPEDQIIEWLKMTNMTVKAMTTLFRRWTEAGQTREKFLQELRSSPQRAIPFASTMYGFLKANVK